MDRIGRITVFLSTLLLAGFEPWPCRAQTSDSPASSIAPPRLGSDFGAIKRSTPAPSGSTTPLAAVPPAAGDPFARLKAPQLEPTDFGFPINLATALRLSDVRPLMVAVGPGQRLGGRSTAHAGQGPLGPHLDLRGRLYPTRRRRPGF